MPIADVKLESVFYYADFEALDSPLVEEICRNLQRK